MCLTQRTNRCTHTEPRRRIDGVLWAVVMGAYVAGVSTLSVDDLVAAVGAESGISKSEVSRICGGLCEMVQAFRGRRSDHVEFPDPQLAPRPRDQRPHRSDQQSHLTRQTRRLRIPPLRPLPHPRPALRRQTQLGAPRHRHSPVKSEEPVRPRVRRVSLEEFEKMRWAVIFQTRTK